MKKSETGMPGKEPEIVQAVFRDTQEIYPGALTKLIPDEEVTSSQVKHIFKSEK